MNFFLSTIAALNFSTLIGSAHGHGYMFEPLSRNYDAWLFGSSWEMKPDVPPQEYCYHCLNTKGPGSVCGTSEGGINYDVWLDILGEPMSWNSNGNIYGESDFITIGSYLASHHTGHMEVRACPMGRASTQDCFDSNILEFVEDLAHNMPKDENHPERGYYYGTPEFNNEQFSMRFKLPEGLVGEEVLLQWWYFTANSCSPTGYAEYYGTNSDLNQEFWNLSLPVCTPEQFPEEFYAGDSPERFVNCAEITIVSEGSDDDDDDDDNSIIIIDDEPTPAPVAPTESPILSTQPPVPVMGIPTIVAPVAAPVASPVQVPTPESNEGGCCSNDYRTCAAWCQESRDQCGSSACGGMKWLDNGALSDDATCEPRWGTCTYTGTAGCCDGLVCKDSTNNPYWKQCLAPGDAAP